jgi:hypothetical protein
MSAYKAPLRDPSTHMVLFCEYVMLSVYCGTSWLVWRLISFDANSSCARSPYTTACIRKANQATHIKYQCVHGHVPTFKHCQTLVMSNASTWGRPWGHSAHRWRVRACTTHITKPSKRERRIEQATIMRYTVTMNLDVSARQHEHIPDFKHSSKQTNEIKQAVFVNDAMLLALVAALMTANRPRPKPEPTHRPRWLERSWARGCNDNNMQCPRSTYMETTCSNICKQTCNKSHKSNVAERSNGNVTVV